ncbi:BglII/BstYI family type II restriction endonuclease [Paracoccus panacisoli]|uniref:BglII/BstYI family type II restriction endonuclease n=1 Tax=Paracoccus panacisoli TaxID=1510163 RepID=A0ABV6T8G3_9RHOB
MFQTQTYDDPLVLPPEARDHWAFMETNSACAVMKATCPSEWSDIVDVLSTYRLSPSSWLQKGGNRGDIAKQIDGRFAERGWREARLDLATTGLLFGKNNEKLGELPAVHQEGYLVDNFKNRIVLDVEWNAKDGNLDRDLASYRSWYEAGVISAGVIITKHLGSLRALAHRIWDAYQAGLPVDQKSKLPIDLGTTTTTTFEKAQLRMRRGVMGTCPVLIVAATEATWSGEPFGG